jgi:hypothetical protein
MYNVRCKTKSDKDKTKSIPIMSLVFTDNIVKKIIGTVEEGGNKDDQK